MKAIKKVGILYLQNSDLTHSESLILARLRYLKMNGKDFRHYTALQAKTDFGICPKTFYRAMGGLERRGFISRTRTRGRGGKSDIGLTAFYNCKANTVYFDYPRYLDRLQGINLASAKLLARLLNLYKFSDDRGVAYPLDRAKRELGFSKDSYYRSLDALASNDYCEIVGTSNGAGKRIVESVRVHPLKVHEAIRRSTRKKDGSHSQNVLLKDPVLIGQNENLIGQNENVNRTKRECHSQNVLLKISRKPLQANDPSDFFDWLYVNSNKIVFLIVQRAIALAEKIKDKETTNGQERLVTAWPVLKLRALQSILADFFKATARDQQSYPLQAIASALTACVENDPVLNTAVTCAFAESEKDPNDNWEYMDGLVYMKQKLSKAKTRLFILTNLEMAINALQSDDGRLRLARFIHGAIDVRIRKFFRERLPSMYRYGPKDIFSTIRADELKAFIADHVFFASMTADGAPVDLGGYFNERIREHFDRTLALSVYDNNDLNNFLSGAGHGETEQESENSAGTAIVDLSAVH